jgi:hypothetical protein
MNASMKTIQEAELIGLSQGGLVSQMWITQVGESEYQISVEFTHKRGRWQLVTERKVIRVWANLDRLARHIRNKYGKIDCIYLSLIHKEPPNEADEGEPPD